MTYDVLTDDVDRIAAHLASDPREVTEAVSQLRDTFPGQWHMFSESMPADAIARALVQAFGTYHIYR